MKNEITVGRFLEWLKKSIWKELPDKSSLYAGYYSRIEGLLHGLSETIPIKDLDSLEGLTERNSFESFIRESSVEELDKRFYAIAAEIGTWKKHMADMSLLGSKNAIGKKKGRVGIVAIVLLLLIALAGGIILVTTSLDESPLNKIMGAVLTGLDIVLGISFFLYEYVSDHKEKAMGESIEQAKESGMVDQVINTYIGKQVNKNKGNVINGNVENHIYH